ncbi:hypothetical protein QP166_15070 [Sphingomonas sp. LR60]
MADKEKLLNAAKMTLVRTEDRDILGKRQQDLTSDDLKGDARDSKVE